MLKLSKTVPARTHTLRFNWVARDFCVMNQRYREIRSISRNPMDTCAWCKHAFQDGEMMALGQPEKGKNKVLCQACCELLEEENA